jgi:hypothetical protein
VSATFRSYHIKAKEMPDVLNRLFIRPQDIPAPFHPFETQYDTYLLKYKDITE